ncbi:MAG: hypothetical protein U0527_16605 [Candidatus Eisenbacteria bacterium]
MRWIPPLILVLLLGARFAMTFAPSSWGWGLDPLAGAPLVVQLSLLLLGGTAVLAAWPRSTGNRRGESSQVALRATVLLSWTLLLLLPCQHFLLGDSQTYVSALDRGVQVSGTTHREPLPVAIIAGVHQLLGGPGIRAFQVTGLLLAVIASLAAVAIAKRISADGGERLAILSALTIGGGLQLFARYAEYYAFALAAGLLFLWCALNWIERKGPLWLVGVSYVLAGLCHAVFALVAPAVFYLLWLAWRRGERRAMLVGLLASSAVGFGVMAAIHYPFAEIAKEASRGSMFLPPLGAKTERTAYSAFAPAHAMELVNLVALVAPGLFLLLPIVAGWKSERARFAAWLLPGALLFLGFAQAELGMLRDWDVFVVPIMLVVFALLVSASERPAPRELRRLGVPLALLGLSTAAAWMQSNHDPKQARARLERSVANASLYGPKSRGEVWRYLSSGYASDQALSGAIRAAVHAIEAEPDDRQNYRLLVSLEIEQGSRSGRSVDDALAQCARDLVGIAHRAGYLEHGIAFGATLAGRPDLALAAAQRGVADEPKSSELAATLGDMLRRVGRDAEAEQAYRDALAIDPNLPRANVGLATLAGLRGDRAALTAAVQDALRRAPWSPQAQQFRGLVESGKSDEQSLRNYIYVR